MQKNKSRWRTLSVLCVALLLSVLCAIPAGAATLSRTPGKVTSIDVWRYERIPIHTEDGNLRTDGRLIGGVTYLPLRAFFEAYAEDAVLTYYSGIRTAELRGKGLVVSARDGSNILYANGRCLYSDMPIKILSDGSMYVPIRALAKVLTLDVFWSEKWRSVTLSGTPTPLEDGTTYYDEADLHWLSRIISAESRGEPFIGQVAVGNVVLNRVAHHAYPDTIKEVIFDRQSGVVQFSPVADGSIWQTPHETSVTAAKVCLEGDTVSERILFFYAPSMVSSTWIERNRPYAFTIKSHRFFY